MNEVIDKTKESINWKFLQVITLVAPVLGYSLAYTHEVAYCDWFKIPHEFISLTWTTILVSVIGSLFGIYIIMFPFIMMMSMTKYSKRPMGPIGRRLYYIFVIFIAIFFFAFRYFLVRETVYIVGYLIFMGAFLFLFPLFDPGIRKIKGYREKLAAYDDVTRKREIPFLKWLDLKTFIIIMVFLGSFVGANFDGRAQAFSQEEFLIPSSPANTVVLRIYGDDLICARFDPQTNIVQRTFLILNTNSSPNTMFTLTKTGQLYPAK